MDTLSVSGCSDGTCGVVAVCWGAEDGIIGKCDDIFLDLVVCFLNLVDTLVYDNKSVVIVLILLGPAVAALDMLSSPDIFLVVVREISVLPSSTGLILPNPPVRHGRDLTSLEKVGNLEGPYQRPDQEYFCQTDQEGDHRVL